MNCNITLQQLTSLNIDEATANHILNQINSLLQKSTHAKQAWQDITRLSNTHHYPFSLYLLLFTLIYPNWQHDAESAPAVFPSNEVIQTANITQWIARLKFNQIKDFHQWSYSQYHDFWQAVVKQLPIIFDQPYEKICDLSQGITSPIWFPKARLNIANSCFHLSLTTPAIIFQDKNKNLITLSHHELNNLTNQIANSLVQNGFLPNDIIAIVMPMNYYAVAIYLGIIKMGGVVISIPDSFSAEEMATRLSIGQAKAIFTQDFVQWNHKKIPLYDKIKNSAASLIVIPDEEKNTITLRDRHKWWEDFLVSNTEFTAVSCDPMSACHILFSSGTTATPKAMVWNHTTPIKAASDGYFHQNIQEGDVLAWPTNLGWMMGPWLIFAALINKATLALYTEAPKDSDFGNFVQLAKVTMLGVVPTLVASWRESGCMEACNWHGIKVFSSTGECSNPQDMLYLMWLGGFKPIIEYCGGTEIGGAYLSSTVVAPNYPSLFTTPTMGLNITILDEEGKASDQGEVAIIPPSIGLSTSLLNADHDEVYFANMPLYNGMILRRHGDQIKKWPQGCYSILGRVDDTMNLSGIKISAAEIERSLAGLEHITEIAAIAVAPPQNGPHWLIIYAATSADLDKSSVTKQMQMRINAELNPLFKIHDLIFMKELPKTASNKIMRRMLRKQYQAGL